MIIKENSLKEIIIDTLSSEWPLSLKEIHNRIKYKKEVTCQAVHKTLNWLKNKGIVAKDEKRYLLNKNWIKKFETLAHKLSNTYKIEEDLEYVLKECKVFFTSFARIVDLGNFLMYKFFRLPQNGKPFVAITQHAYAIVGLSAEEIIDLRKFLENNEAYLITKHDTEVDRMYAREFREMGIKVKTGINKLYMPMDIFIVGNYIAELFYEKRSLKYWHDLFDSAKNYTIEKEAESLHISYPNQVLVVVFYNPQIAQRIREFALAFFE